MSKNAHGINHVPDKNNVWDTVSTFIHPTCMFPPTDGLDNTEWAYFLSDLHTKLIRAHRRVPGFATGSPCGAWGRGWNICVMYDGQLSGLGFLKNNSWYVILVQWRGFYIYIYNLFLVLMCLDKFFSVIWALYAFTLRYFVLPYSIDVVSTLSYYIEHSLLIQHMLPFGVNLFTTKCPWGVCRLYKHFSDFWILRDKTPGN